MAVAGVIAAFGVLDHSAILIVGAMAVSPDLLPLTAAAVAIVARRPLLLGKALSTLLPGLVTAVVAAWVVTLALRDVRRRRAPTPTSTPASSTGSRT